MTTAPLNATSIAPGITANDIQQSIRFYVDGLGFEVVDRNEVDGVLRFAMLRSGGAMFGIGQDDFAKGKDRPKGVAVRFYYSTREDVVSVANRIKAAGFKLDNEPAPLPWGPMGFSVTDPDGFAMTIASDA
jgi:uncharacterized glyoxalase superfamily protein PhnB